jgi:hypothetical protein
MRRDSHLATSHVQNSTSNVRLATREEHDQNLSWSSHSNYGINLHNRSQFSNLSFVSEKRLDNSSIQSMRLLDSPRRIAVEQTPVISQRNTTNSNLEHSQILRSAKVNPSAQFINHDFGNTGSTRVVDPSSISINGPLTTTEIRYPPRITILSPVEVLKPINKTINSPLQKQTNDEDIVSFDSEVLKLSRVNVKTSTVTEHNCPSPNTKRRSILISKNQNGGTMKRSGLRENTVTFDPRIDIKTYDKNATPEKPDSPKLIAESKDMTSFPIRRKSSIDADNKQFPLKFSSIDAECKQSPAKLLRESEDEHSDSEKEYELESIFNESRRKVKRSNKSLRDILNTPRMSVVLPANSPILPNSSSPLQQPVQSMDPKFIALTVIVVIVFSIIYEIFTQNKSNPYL